VATPNKRPTGLAWEEFCRRYEAGECTRNLAHDYDVSTSSITFWIRSSGLQRGVGVNDENKPLTIPHSGLGDSDVWGALETLQTEYQKLNAEQDVADVKVDDDKPILLIYSDDWHIGHEHCDMVRLRADLQSVYQHEGVYLITGGDMFDNVITSSPRGTQFEQLAPPKIQKRLVEQALDWIKDRVLAIFLGNHPARSILDDDFDPCAWFAHLCKCAYLGYHGLVKLHLGDQEYRILCAHSYRMHSSFNKTHSAKRLMDMVMDADAVFTGHKHEIAVEMTRVRSEMRFFGQAGTYLKTSQFGRRMGYTRGMPEMPGVILWPDKKKILGVHDAFSDGIHILGSYRC
jgi:hypothetical protein